MALCSKGERRSKFDVLWDTPSNGSAFSVETSGRGAASKYPGSNATIGSPTYCPPAGASGLGNADILARSAGDTMGGENNGPGGVPGSGTARSARSSTVSGPGAAPNADIAARSAGDTERVSNLSSIKDWRPAGARSKEPAPAIRSRSAKPPGLRPANASRAAASRSAFP